MNLKIDPHLPIPIYVQIVEQIKECILFGYLKQDEPLPSVRHMANELEVNSLTIQKAYKLLEADGFISIKKGVGATVVKDSNQSEIEKIQMARKILESSLNKAKSILGSTSKVKSIVKEILEER